MGGSASLPPVSVLAEGETAGPFATRRCPGYASRTMHCPPEIQTMQDIVLPSFKKFAAKEYMGVRKCLPGGGYEDKFTYITYAEAETIAFDLGSGLWEALNILPRDFVGIFAENRSEWVHMINASSIYGHALVSLYETFGESALSCLVKHSRMRTILVSTKNLPKFAQVIEATGTFDLESIVILGPPSEQLSERFDRLGLRTITFDEVCVVGHANRKPIPTIDREWIHYVCYSSGTTGVPKGVIISHRSQACNTVDAVISLNVNEHERHLSYLPLAHVFERSAISALVLVGGKMGFLSGSIANLTADMQILKPTLLCAVPRVINRIYDAVMDTVSRTSLLKRSVFWGMWYWKRFWLKRGSASPTADAIVFNAIRAKTGGCLKQFIIGGAALDPWIHEVMQCALGCPLRTGYGSSELGTGTVVNSYEIAACKPGTVGGPRPNCEIKLEPIDGYDDPLCGEILAGGEMLCSGYLYDNSQTQQLFLNEDRTWCRTGDIGKWDPDGYLLIVDRLRSIFKLAQGEYVAAELLSATYEAAVLVDQIFVYGDASRDHLVAIVVPNRDHAAHVFEKTTVNDREFRECCRDQRLRTAILAELEAIAVAKKVPGYEKIRAVLCEPEPWTTDNDLMTPTFKLRRKKLADKYRKEIEDLYGE